MLARDAAGADAAATVIANAVDVEWPGIERSPANQLRDDTDLGAIPVTVHVPPLPPAAVRSALARGEAQARALQARSLISAAALVCQGQARLVTPPALASSLLATTATAP